MRTIIGVKSAMIEVHVPRLFPTLSIRDTLTMEKWYVEGNDVVRPGELLVSLETPLDFLIFLPHQVLQRLIM
jgi:hypothetical protein